MQNIKPCPAPLLNPRTNPPPPPHPTPILFYFIYLIFLLFQKYAAVENKYFVLRLPGNKFSGQPPPPPQYQMVVPYPRPTPALNDVTRDW